MASAFKPCNCKKSNCLKVGFYHIRCTKELIILFNIILFNIQLYCECFSNGAYCVLDKCNCNNCQNNSENDSFRRDAIDAILERNPNAFVSIAVFIFTFYVYLCTYLEI